MKVLPSLHATEVSARSYARRYGGTVTEVQQRLRDMTHRTLWEVTTPVSAPHATLKPPAAPPPPSTTEEKPDPQQRRAPRTVVLKDGRTVTTGGYCAPNRCYCHTCPGASRGYTREDLLATARTERARLDREGVMLAPLPKRVLERARRVMLDGGDHGMVRARDE